MVTKTNDKYQEEFKQEYLAGKKALEAGKYSLSIQHLERAINLISSTSRVGGEVQMWLFSAYQAAHKQTEAMAVCKKLSKHPHPDIRKKGKDLLYIMEAPRLERPKEWMLEIPDLTGMSESELKYRRGSGVSKTKAKTNYSTENIDLNQVNTQDNQFIWVALIAIFLTLISLIWFS